MFLLRETETAVWMTEDNLKSLKNRGDPVTDRKHVGDSLR